MLSRFAIPLLCAAAIVFACGPRPHTAESTPASAPAPAPTKQERDDIAARPLASSLDVTVGTGVRFALHVTNRADRNVELMFPSGMTHDFVVKDSAGREVWRFSEGRMYTQALQSKLLSGSESATWEETWTPGARRGRFTVVASLNSNNHPVEQVAEFELR